MLDKQHRRTIYRKLRCGHVLHQNFLEALNTILCHSVSLLCLYKYCGSCAPWHQMITTHFKLLPTNVQELALWLSRNRHLLNKQSSLTVALAATSLEGMGTSGAALWEGCKIKLRFHENSVKSNQFNIVIGSEKAVNNLQKAANHDSQQVRNLHFKTVQMKSLLNELVREIRHQRKVLCIISKLFEAKEHSSIL